MKTVKKFFFACCAVLFLAAFSFAEESDGFLSLTLKETGRVLSSPFSAKKENLYIVGGIIGAGLAVYSLDGQIRHNLGGIHSSFNNDFLKVAKEFGNGAYDLLFIGGYGLFGAAKKDGYMKETALMAAESFLAANAVGSLLKYSVGRARPYIEEGKKHFTPFVFKTSRTSFPSGHTVSAFSVATVFAQRSDYISVKILVYTMASATAFERVYSDKHWASDVFFGAALGYFVASDIVGGKKEKKSDVSFYPVGNGIMIALKI